MIKGWLIYSKADAIENKSFIDWFIDECNNQNIELQLIYREDLSIGIFDNEQKVLVKRRAAKKPAFAIVRTVEPLLNTFLENHDICTFNSAYISTVCNNKSLTHMKVNKLNIPMVDTFFLKKTNLTDIPPLSFPFVLKEANGRSGKQVYFVASKKEWIQCLDSINSDNVLVQTCDVQLGKDVRVFIVGKEIIGAVLRESKSDFRANYKLGGSATWYPLNDEEKEIVERIINHFDFGMVGIDFLISKEGKFLFNEIEDIVGSRILSKVSDKNILRKYVSHIQSKIN